MSHIPKHMAHIWIGPKIPPIEWMKTWIEKHPNWKYTLYDNNTLTQFPFRTKAQINEYMKRAQYEGVADLMRYELLYEYGGFIAAADSECLLPIDDLIENEGDLFTVYENEFTRGELVSPIQASAPGHPFLKTLIDHLSEVPPECLDAPWKETGNLFLAKMIKKHQPKITIWPSYYLIPTHFLGIEYEGDGPIYARQKFGTTSGAYQQRSILHKLNNRLKILYRRKQLKNLRRARQQHGLS